MAKRLSSLPEGSKIKIKEDYPGIDTFPYYVVDHNYEPQLNGAGRTLMARTQSFPGSPQWNHLTKNNAYSESSIDSTCVEQANRRFDDFILKNIGTTKFYCTAGNGDSSVEVIERISFAVSVTEIGLSDNNANVEGTKLPISDLLREIKDSNGSSGFWTRTPDKSTNNKAFSYYNNSVSAHKVEGVYTPLFMLFTFPETLVVSDSPDSDGYYTIKYPPTVPESISFGEPHRGEPLQITCSDSTDPDGSSITYVWERQIDSGEWTQIGSGAEASIVDIVPENGEKYNVRVKARNAEGVESEYCIGTAKDIIYNQPPTTPGVPQYKYPLPGEEMPVKWQASTDPENRTVTYIVETKLGDGEWTQARETPETSCLVSVPQVSAAGTMIIVRVKAKDQEGAESAYSTGETVEILYHKVIRKIPWQQGKPFKARQYTYNGKKQYQTMREGALAGIEAEP